MPLREYDVCMFLTNLAAEIEDFFVFDSTEAKVQMVEAAKHLRWCAAVLMQRGRRVS
jgi:hypothetical protein